CGQTLWVIAGPDVEAAAEVHARELGSDQRRSGVVHAGVAFDEHVAGDDVALRTDRRDHREAAPATHADFEIALRPETRRQREERGIDVRVSPLGIALE